MDITEMVRKNIYDYLVSDGCKKSVAANAADEGVKFFNQCNHKDPYFDSLCHAALVYAENYDSEYKFKKPSKSTGKPFVYGKPKSRKQSKTQHTFFE